MEMGMLGLGRRGVGRGKRLARPAQGGRPPFSHDARVEL